MKKMGIWAPPYYGKSNFYEKKKAKAQKKMAKLQEKIKELREVISECENEIAKNGANKWKLGLK